MSDQPHCTFCNGIAICEECIIQHALNKIEKLETKVNGTEKLYLKVSEENTRLLKWIRRLEKRLDKK